MTSVNRDEFLSSFARKTKNVPLPELGPGRYIRVRALSVVQRMSFADAHKRLEVSPEAVFELYGELIYAAAIDDSDQRLFTSRDDIAIISELGLEVLERVCAVILEISGISEEAQTERKKKSKKTK